jgi:type II secretory pathway component PulF
VHLEQALLRLAEYLSRLSAHRRGILLALVVPMIVVVVADWRIRRHR